MSYSEATSLMEALEIKDHESNLEIALEVINKYGSYKKAMQATISIEFKKKEALLIALLGSEEKQLEDEHMEEALRLIRLAHSIEKQVFKDSQELSIQFSDLIEKIRLDKMGISQKDIKILDSVSKFRGHRNLISNINCFQDGNIQLKAFIEAIKYANFDEVDVIANPIQNLRINRK